MAKEVCDYIRTNAMEVIETIEINHLHIEL